MAIRYFNFRSTGWMGKQKQNFIKLVCRTINAVLLNLNGSDRPTDDMFPCIPINLQNKSLCSMFMHRRCELCIQHTCIAIKINMSKLFN